MSNEEKKNFRKWFDQKRLKRAKLLVQLKKDNLQRKRLQKDLIKAWKIIKQSKTHFIDEYFDNPQT
ncbi:MAG: hypothetical protein ACFFHV_14310 [Promethearchaeota archaeon]